MDSSGDRCGVSCGFSVCVCVLVGSLGVPVVTVVPVSPCGLPFGF